MTDAPSAGAAESRRHRPGSTRWRKGARKEHRSRDLLEAAGYAVTRAAGSLGDWDLIGLSATDVVLVQVRTRQTRPAPWSARRSRTSWRPRIAESSCIDTAMVCARPM